MEKTYEVNVEQLVRDRVGPVQPNETVRFMRDTYTWPTLAAAEAQFITFVQAALNGARIVSVDVIELDPSRPIMKQYDEVRFYRGTCDVSECAVVIASVA